MKRFGIFALVTICAIGHAEVPQHTAVMTHAMCTAEGISEQMNRIMGRGKGAVAFENSIRCLEDKLPAAIAEAGKHDDLRAAIKGWHVRAIAWCRNPRDRLVENDEHQAMANLEMEAKLAGLWH